MKYRIFLTLIAAFAVSPTACVSTPGPTRDISAELHLLPVDTVRAREVALRALRAYYRGRSGNLAYSGNVDEPDSRRRIRSMAFAEALNRSLDSAATMAPRDSVIVSSHVWHRVTTGQHAAADSMATAACTAEVWSKWWCSAMRGFTKYNLGDFAASDEFFEAALAEMPESKRCLWIDVSHVLNDFALTNIMKEVPCEMREERNAVIWWLADPMWTIPGNERRTAHYARWTEATLADSELRFMGSRPLNVDEIGEDLSFFLRLGEREISAGYELGCSTRGRLDCRSHFSWDRYMPWDTAVSAPFSNTVFDYELALRQSRSIARYGAEVPAGFHNPLVAPESFESRQYQIWRQQGYGEVLSASTGKMHTLLDAQTGIILRRSGPVLLAAFDPRFASIYEPVDIEGRQRGPTSMERFVVFPRYLPALKSLPMRVAAAASRGPGSPILVSRPLTNLAGEVARIMLPLEPGTDSALVSLEAYGVVQHLHPASSRHRFAVFAPKFDSSAKITSSDLILWYTGNNREISTVRPPANSEEALAVMLPRSTVVRPEHLGLYWEVYGLTTGDEPEFELSVVRADSTGFLLSLAQGVGLASRGGTVLTKWTAPAVQPIEIGADGQTAHTLVIAINALNPGDYELGLTTRIPGDSAVTVRKLIRVQ